MKSSLLAVFLLTVFAATAQTSESSSAKNSSIQINTDSVYSKVEIEAVFIGGPKSWARFLEREFEQNKKELKKIDMPKPAKFNLS